MVVNEPDASATLTVKLEVPPCVGVPLRTPAALNVRPDCRAPGGMDHVYGETPSGYREVSADKPIPPSRWGANQS